MKALSNFGRYIREKSRFSTWIFTIARNTLIDYYRTNKKSLRLDDMELTDPEALPEEAAEKKAERDCLIQCLGKLTAEEQEIIRLKFGAELNNREIARLINLSDSNVGVKLFRAVKKLKMAFEETWNG